MIIFPLRRDSPVRPKNTRGQTGFLGGRSTGEAGRVGRDDAAEAGDVEAARRRATADGPARLATRRPVRPVHSVPSGLAVATVEPPSAQPLRQFSAAKSQFTSLSKNAWIQSGRRFW